MDGMDIFTVIRIYLRKVELTRSIPFHLEAPQDTVQVLPVDADTQSRMDAVALAWRKRNR